MREKTERHTSIGELSFRSVGGLVVLALLCSARRGGTAATGRRSTGRGCGVSVLERVCFLYCSTFVNPRLEIISDIELAILCTFGTARTLQAVGGFCPRSGSPRRRCEHGRRLLRV
jgi:hypothetical protein